MEKIGEFHYFLGLQVTDLHFQLNHLSEALKKGLFIPPSKQGDTTGSPTTKTTSNEETKAKPKTGRKPKTKVQTENEKAGPKDWGYPFDQHQ